MEAGFVLHLQSAERYERIADVASFVGADASGSFGIRAGHADFMSVLDYGLARLRCVDGRLFYVASPGAVVFFADRQLSFCTRRYLRDDDYERVCALLTGQLADEENALKTIKDHLQRLERELFRRLRELDRRHP